MHFEMIDRQIAQRMVARLRQTLPPLSRRTTVLLTGFSSALDLALAHVFAQRNYDILLCSQDDVMLHQVLPGLRGRSPDIRIEKVLIADDDPDGPTKLHDAVDELGLRVRIVLANTHAITRDGTPRSDRLFFTPFLREMAKSGRGRVLISNSRSIDRALPHVLDQPACETSLNLAMALWQRWQGRGIAVAALLAGSITPDTDTTSLANAAYHSLIYGNSKVFTSVTATLDEEAMPLEAVAAA